MFAIAVHGRQRRRVNDHRHNAIRGYAAHAKFAGVCSKRDNDRHDDGIGVLVGLGCGSSPFDEICSIVIWGSLIRAFISDKNSSAFWPGSRRQSSVASATEGITFAFGGLPSPLRSEVKEIVFPWIAFMNLFDANTPTVSFICCTSVFGFSVGGNSFAFSIARISRSFALSGIGWDACPDVPTAFIFSQSTCLSATETPKTSFPGVYTLREPTPPSSSTYPGFSSAQWR